MTDRTKSLLLDLKEVLQKHNAFVMACNDENGGSWIDIGYDDTCGYEILDIDKDLNVESIDELLVR